MSEVKMAEAVETDAKKVGELSLEIVGLLANESSATRLRAVNAALVILGEFQPQVKVPKHSLDGGENESQAINSKAAMWTKQNNLTEDEVAKVFHLDGGDAEFIAGSVPGQSAKERTCNAYVLVGVGQLLANGNPAFSDKSARELCATLGFYDNANHATYLTKGKGNTLTGSKEKGWTLTAPGLTRAATLIRELAK